MSWHLKTCGTKEEVTAAIDEAIARNSGMPASVGSYLKDAVNALDLTNGAGGKSDGVDRCMVVVESSGHRPMYVGGEEKCLVTMVWRGPVNQPAPR